MTTSDASPSRDRARSGNGSRKKPATIYDVAAAAGVSTQTVTRYMNGFAGIAPKTRAKVERAMRELAYRPDPVARALRTRTPTRLLLFVHELAEAGPINIVRAASRAAADADYVLEIVDLDTDDSDASRQILQRTDQSYVAGALALAPTAGLADLFATFPFQAPILLEVNGDGLEGPHAQGPVDPGTELVVEHLHALGHRSIGVVAGPEGWFSTAKRLQTALDRSHELGMDVAFVEHGDWSAASGHRIATALPRRSIPSAIVCANDEMAMGVLSALADVGVQVPTDVSVTGFDDVRGAEFYHPPLTTIHVDFRAAGEIAVHRLLAMIADADETPLTLSVPKVVPPRLVVRRSTSAPPARR
jgi:LacI family transcriptional regulator